MNCDRCEEVLEVDGIEPDCDGCDLPILVPENRDIWDLYQIINTQFVYDFQALPLVFEIFGIRGTRDEVKILLNKLIVIHGVIREDAWTKQG